MADGSEEIGVVVAAKVTLEHLNERHADPTTLDIHLGRSEDREGRRVRADLVEEAVGNDAPIAVALELVLGLLRELAFVLWNEAMRQRAGEEEPRSLSFFSTSPPLTSSLHLLLSASQSLLFPTISSPRAERQLKF